MTSARSRWLLLAAAILSEVSGSLTLKAALDRPALGAVAVTCYVASFALLAQVLRRGVALGVAYGVWAACGVALTACMSALVFDESLTAVTGAGIALIAAGVLAVEVGSHRARAQTPEGAS